MKMMGTTLEDVYKIKLGGDEGIGEVLSSGPIEGSRDDREDGSKYLEDSGLDSLDDMCGGNEDGKCEVSAIVKSM